MPLVKWSKSVKKHGTVFLKQFVLILYCYCISQRFLAIFGHFWRFYKKTGQQLIFFRKNWTTANFLAKKLDNTFAGQQLLEKLLSLYTGGGVPDCTFFHSLVEKHWLNLRSVFWSVWLFIFLSCIGNEFWGATQNGKGLKTTKTKNHQSKNHQF